MITDFQEVIPVFRQMDNDDASKKEIRYEIAVPVCGGLYRLDSPYKGKYLTCTTQCRLYLLWVNGHFVPRPFHHTHIAPQLESNHPSYVRPFHPKTEKSNHPRHKR